jgi:PAS domain S-box-containing protein
VASLSGELSEEQLKAQAILSNMGDGVIVVDQGKQIQLINQAAQNMTGWDADSASGIQYNSVLNLKTADDRELDDKLDPFQQAWGKGANIVESNLVMNTKGGHKVALSISVSPIYDNNHRVSGGIAVFRDISKEKDVERQRNEFISTASHEMRTPVAAIEGYIALATNANVSTIDERARNYLNKAHESTQHLGQLFKDLLQITKLEDNPGAKDAAQSIVNVSELIGAAVDDMQFAAKAKNLTLVYRTSNTGSLYERSIAPIYNVKINPERLREVVMNFIDNAVRFTPQGGITVTITGTDDLVTVSIADTGLGIAKEDMGHLFQKFYRVDNSATRTIGGTGLGLYLCRTVIEQANGRVWVESKVGEGTTFSFSLPRVDSAEVAATQTTPAATPNVTQPATSYATTTTAPTNATPTQSTVVAK